VLPAQVRELNAPLSSLANLQLTVRKEDVGRGGGDRTITPDANAQVIHSTYRSNRKNRQNRMSKVHGGYTERGSGTFSSEYATQTKHSLLITASPQTHSPQRFQK